MPFTEFNSRAAFAVFMLFYLAIQVALNEQ